ncbi:MAG: hypothetical protein JWM10_138 [Myxococcaceae bacterium]|nr:hypothetical protein [Myxococcaceae bacterium]
MPYRTPAPPARRPLPAPRPLPAVERTPARFTLDQELAIAAGSIVLTVFLALAECVAWSC